MATAKLLKMDGTEAGTVELSDKVFSVAPNPTLVHDVAVALLANQRQGNHETKTRKDVRGGGQKPYRQKGTGNARRGSIREPHLRGGGTVFGPHKRSYRKHVPTRMGRQALCCALSSRAGEEGLFVLDAAAVDTPRTKPVKQMMDRVSPDGKRTLVVTAEVNRALLLSARNLPKVAVRTAADVNALDVLNAARVVVEQGALSKLEERLV
jgi:large subunit ribosomal protein L4